MKRPFLFQRKPSLEALEGLLGDYAQSTARGDVRLIAFASALEKTGIPSFAVLARALRLQIGNSSQAVGYAVSQISDLELRSMSQQVLFFLARQRVGLNRLPRLMESLRRAAETSRWINQHLMQARSQSCFLMLFVPCVSFGFIWNGWARFTENISYFSGYMLFCLSLLLYFGGCFFVQVIFRHQKSLVVNTSLSHPAGQLSLTRSIYVSGGSQSNIRTQKEQLHSAPNGSALSAWRQLTSFGIFPFRHQTATQRPPSWAEAEFLKRVENDFLCASPVARDRWLDSSQRLLLQALQTRAAAEAGRLNLALLAVMATFFLHALFLMLGLSGIDFNPGTME